MIERKILLSSQVHRPCVHLNLSAGQIDAFVAVGGVAVEAVVGVVEIVGVVVFDIMVGVVGIAVVAAFEVGV